MDPTLVEQWYGQLMFGLGTSCACVGVVLGALLWPRPRNRRRHRLGRRLVVSGQLRRMR